MRLTQGGEVEDQADVFTMAEWREKARGFFRRRTRVRTEPAEHAG